ncbi:transmembrane protein [Halococcus thailandensis JCM 13552]|uniref:Transmembrane protein n=2 Tax=Halococcus thailandensis TaxID=335952 RepID=M0NEB8_9EURY|nr:transmembrane protein [Halococcus thailandensis JCM 13552]
MPVRIVRAGVGVILLLIVSGGLLARLFGVSVRPLGRFGLYMAGSSLAILALVTTAMSTLLPLVGVVNPLSVVPLTLGVSILLVSLVTLTIITETPILDASFDAPHARSFRPLMVVALGCLPVLAVVGAALMNRFAVNTGMFVFIGATVVIVMWTAMRLPTRLYPAVVASISISTLIHHNLLSNHVIGADIQGLSFVARLLTQLHHWPPVTGGTAAAIPVITTVPASFSMLTGISLTTTYTVVYVLVFALVPLGVFAVCRSIFDDEIALFAALFFLFYHLTFTVTPGKQLLSELFVMGLIMLLIQGDLRRNGRSAAIVLLSVGLVGTHYGMTFLFGIAMLFATVVLFVVNQWTEGSVPRPPVSYPVALLAGASVWYAAASTALLDRLASIPVVVVGQAITLFHGGAIEGAGASYVGNQLPLGTLTFVLYGLFAALACIGVAWRGFAALAAFRRGAVPNDVGYTALTVPVFVFLAASYFFVFNLWADRAYQMALVFVAPFMPLGYRYVIRFVSEVIRRVLPSQSAPKRVDGGTREGTGSSPGPRHAVRWGVLAILLCVLLVINSGMAFALTGSAQNSAFNQNANDLVFSQKEVQGATWLKTHVDPQRFETHHPFTSDRTGAIRIYADTRSTQLLRSVMPPTYYNVKVIPLKSKWRSHVNPDQLNDGYVMIRHASVASVREANESYSRIPKRDVRRISERGTVVFDNNQMRIVKLGSNVIVGEENR